MDRPNQFVTLYCTMFTVALSVPFFITTHITWCVCLCVCVPNLKKQQYTTIKHFSHHIHNTAASWWNSDVQWACYLIAGWSSFLDHLLLDIAAFTLYWPYLWVVSFEHSVDQIKEVFLWFFYNFFQAKAGGKKLQRVALSVNLRGIKVVDLGTEDTHLEVSIYR